MIDGKKALLFGPFAGFSTTPGASTAVTAMIDVLKKCFPQEMKSPE